MEYMWLHIYAVHFGALVAFCLTAQVVKTGLPSLKYIPGLLLSAVALSSVIALFSSHSHNHYLNNLLPKAISDVKTDVDGHKGEDTTKR